MTRSWLLAGGVLVAACTVPVAAEAQVIDLFDAGSATLTANGLPTYSYFEGAGPIGGRRELYGRDGHSGSPVNVTVDAMVGEVEFYGNVGAPEQQILYGTFIGTVYPGFGTMSPNTGVALNVSKSLEDSILVDIVNVPAGTINLQVRLRTGMGDFAHTQQVYIGLNQFRLSDFSGLTEPAAADIDGIAIAGGVNATAGSGLIINDITWSLPPLHAGLVRQTQLLVEDPNCPDGGIQVDVGIDDGTGLGIADDGVLDNDEVDSTTYVCNGASAPLMPPTLIRTSPTPPDITCPAGGVLIETGVDVDFSGMLDNFEVAASETLCHGLDGLPGETTLIRTSPTPPDSTCPSGGVLVEVGVDLDLNFMLDPQEVVSTDTLCNGADGIPGETTLIRTSPSAPDINCPAGGVRVEAGVDLDLNLMLDPQEVTSFEIICNGEPGFPGETTLIRTSPSAPDATCPAGGVLVEAGVDVDHSGVLDNFEVTSSAVVCNGADGAPGMDGQDGAPGTDGQDGAPGTDGQDGADGQDGEDGDDALTRITTLEVGSTPCPGGGVMVQAGVDTDDNGTLDPAEVTSEQPVCNGSNGKDATNEEELDGGGALGCQQTNVVPVTLLALVGLLRRRRR